MRRIAVSVLLACAVATAGGCAGEPAAPPAPSAAPASSATSDPVAGIPFACETADGLYATLNQQTQAHIQRGHEAEQRGDTATVAKELKALEPTFVSTAAMFAKAADRVADPEMKEALNSLSDAAVQATSFTAFSEFASMQQLTVSGELTIIRKCRDAGYKMVNLV